MTNNASFTQILKDIHKAQDKIAPLIEGLEGEIPEQNMKDYFVKLQILVKENQDETFAGNYENISGEKKEVELADIFNKNSEDAASPPTKLLVLGGAGVGKTTLMQYIAYEWGKRGLWEGKFDYVYRVSLKTLLNDHWKDDYSKEELREDILKCLIHYNLVMRLPDDMDEPSLKEMHWSSTEAETEKVLLLLDGYDEIAHLKNSNNPSKDYQRLEKKIFEHKNLIFTSRPNAISKTMKSQFDKVLENTGLSKSGIEHYFSTYFRGDKRGKEAELRSFLAGNQVIWQICTIPVNIAMLCYIWSTSKSTDNLRQISTVSGLYKNVIDRLGQRYFAKEWNNDDKTDKVTLEEALTNGKFTLDEFKVLAHVAYKALTGGGITVADKDRVETLIIKGGHDKDGEIDLEDEDGISVLSSINYLSNQKMIQDDQKKKVTVTKVYRYGLLKVEGTVTSINNKKSDTSATRISYSFLHLTFQEYLSAYYLKEQLTSDHVSEKEKRKICQYIAEHRNEPRYLMMLKFLAGIVTADQSAKGEYVVKLFWDAVICNVDGVIELGIETKINLMIHLLTQSKVKEKIDSRIPHKDEMVLLIDAVVLNNPFGWVNQLKETDYITGTIKEAVIRSLIDDNLTWSNNKLTEICAKTSSSLQVAIQKMINNATNKESGRSSDTISVLAFRMFIDLYSKLTADERRTVKDRLKGIIKTCIADEKQSQWRLLIQAIEALKKILQESPLSDEESLDFINILVQVPQNNGLIEISIEVIVQIVQASGKETIAVEVINKINDLVPSKEFNLINFTELIVKATTKIIRFTDSKTVQNLGLQKLNAYILDRERITSYSTYSNEYADKSLGLDLYLAESIGELLSLGDDKERIMKNLESIFNRAKLLLDDNKTQFAFVSRPLAVIVSSFNDKEIIAKCVNLLVQFSSEEKNFTKYFAQETLVELGKAFKDKTLILEVIEGLIKNNSQDGEKLKAFSISIMCEVNETTEDVEVLRRETQKIFKALESIKTNFEVSGILRLVMKCKDKELASKLMEYVMTNGCLVNEEDLLKLALIVKDEKEVINKIVEHINRISSGRISVKSPFRPYGLQVIREEMKLSIVLLEVLKEKDEANKIAEILANSIDNGDIATGSAIVGKMSRLVEQPALQKVLPSIWDQIVGLITGSSVDHFRDLEYHLLSHCEKIIECEKALSADKPSNLFETKVFPSIMGLLDEDRVQQKCSGISILRLFMEKTQTVCADLTAKLFDFLIIDENWDVRYRALTAIKTIILLKNDGELAGKVLEKLFDFVIDENLEMRETAKYGIDELMILTQYGNLVQVAEKLFGKFFDRIVDENVEVREIAMSALKNLIFDTRDEELARKLKEKVAEKLFDFLTDENLEMKRRAICGIGSSSLWTNDDKRARKFAEKLLDLLTNENLELKRTAMSGITKLILYMKDDEPARKLAENLAGKLFDLLADEDLEMKRTALSGIGSLIRNMKDEELAEEFARKLADILVDEDLIVKEMDILELDMFIGLIKYDELAAKIKDFFGQVLEKKMNLFAVEERESSKCRIIVQQLQALCVLITNKELAEKVIEVILNCIPSDENLASDLLYSVTRIIINIEDSKLAVKTLQKMRQRNKNYCFEAHKAMILAGEERVILEKIERYPKMRFFDMTIQELITISGLSISSEQLVKSMQHPILDLREQAWRYLIRVFEALLKIFGTIDALLKDVQNLTIEIINRELFGSQLKENVRAGIRKVLATIKSNNAPLEKLHEILMLHLNRIEIFKKHELIEVALAVISYGKEEDAELSKQRTAVELARKVLDFQIKHLDNEGIEWIKNNFDRLVVLYSESKLVIRKLYHKLLEDLEVTSSEEELMIKFINHGLTTSMTRNKEIIFEGRRYELNTQHATQLLDRIATAVIDQEKDILAPQYKAHKPIFGKRNESGMKKASADIEAVYSIIDKTQELASDQWILAEMREQPQGTLILLLEKRNPIGDHVVYRLSQPNHEELRAILIDDEDSRKELEEIFGRYVVGKKFKGRSASVAIGIGNQFLKNDFQELEKWFEGKDAKEYFQQELLGLGSTDRIDCMDKELSTKLTDYEKVLENKLTNKIPQENQLKLKEYFRAFIETFASAYTAAQMVDSGQVQLNSSNMQTKVLSSLISFVPFAGDALSQAATSVGEFMKSRDMIKNARTMKKLASDGTYLNQLVSEIAMKIVLNQSKQSEILKITDEDLERISGKFTEKIAKFISNFNVKIDEFLYTKKFNTAAAKLGNNDANTLIEHWVHQKIQSTDAVTLQSYFVKLVTEATTPTETSKQDHEVAVARPKTPCCSLF